MQNGSKQNSDTRGQSPAEFMETGAFPLNTSEGRGNPKNLVIKEKTLNYNRKFLLASQSTTHTNLQNFS